MKLKLSILGTFVLLAVACSNWKKAVVQPVRVEGTAMAPALNDGDRIFFSRNVDELQRGDIVLFYYPQAPTKSYIKRIIDVVITLQAGNYKLRYKSDDSHSFDRWNAMPPNINFWGIAVYKK